MGAPSDTARTEDSIRLLTYGFRFFETHKLYGANSPLARARVWKGANKEVALGLTHDFYVTLPAGQYKNIQADIQINNPVKAPLTKGQTLGTLNITLNKQVLASEPLVALEDNNKGGLFRNVADTVNYSFQKLFSHSTEKANNG
jgi:D-alanyl-D-alanine carboxypeptidase (penicillin-binding protein 5/6)